MSMETQLNEIFYRRFILAMTNKEDSIDESAVGVGNNSFDL